MSGLYQKARREACLSRENLFGFTEQAVECCPGIRGVPRFGKAGAIGTWRRGHCRSRMGYVARYRDARLEKLALIGLIFRGDAHRDWLQALEACGWLEVGALLTAVQCHSALGTLLEVESFPQHGGAVVASRSGHGLDHPRQSRTGNIQWRAWTLRSRAVFAIKTSVLGTWTVGVVIAPLPVLAVAFHRMLVGLLLWCSPGSIKYDAGVRWIQSDLRNQRDGGILSDGEQFSILDTRENV